MYTDFGNDKIAIYGNFQWGKKNMIKYDPYPAQWKNVKQFDFRK